MLLNGTLAREAGAELLGTGLLVAIVILAAAFAARLAFAPPLRAAVAGGLIALGLGVLIAALQPISGAHFNPVVTLALAMDTGRWEPVRILSLIGAQLLGGALGASLGLLLRKGLLP